MFANNIDIVLLFGTFQPIKQRSILVFSWSDDIYFSFFHRFPASTAGCNLDASASKSKLTFHLPAQRLVTSIGQKSELHFISTHLHCLGLAFSWEEDLSYTPTSDFNFCFRKLENFNSCCSSTLLSFIKAFEQKWPGHLEHLLRSISGWTSAPITCHSTPLSSNDIVTIT